MQFLVLIIFALFAGVELFQWLKGIILPLPLYVLAGAFLAIASNYGKGLALLFNPGEVSQPLQMEVIVEPNTAELNETSNPALFLDEASKP